MHAEQQLVEQMQFALVPITELNVLVYMDSKEILLPHADHVRKEIIVINLNIFFLFNFVHPHMRACYIFQCPRQLNLAWMWVAPPMMNVLTILHAKTDSV